MQRTPAPPADRRDQRGQALSAFVAVVLTALFGIAGLVIDGGAQSAARTNAEAVAAHAARAGADAGALARASGVPVDGGSVRAAAERVVRDRGLVAVVAVEGGIVRVTTTASTRTVFLSLVGVTTLSASGEATASLER